MSNIPTLALIPSAYKTSKVYSVLPSNGDGDFTFSRTTVATRVNKDGFIETVGESISDELVTNGGFYTDTDWTKQNGSTISGGVATIIANGAITSTAGNRAIQQDNVFVAGKTYEITFIARQTVGSGKLQIGNGFSSLVQKDLTSEFATYSFRVVAGAVNSADHIISVGGLTVSDEFEVRDISVKEVLIDTNIPRIDYSDGGCPSLLLEPTRTNLITYSSEVNEANTANQVTGTGQTPTLLSDNNLAPDGSLTACKWNFNVGSGISASDISIINRNYTTTSGVDYTMSVYLYAELDNTQVYIRAAGSNYTLKTLNAGWNRVEVTDTSTSTSSYWLIGLRQGLSGGTINSNVTVKIWGLQVEQGSYATSYIPTNGSISTRSQDYCNGAGNATLFNTTSGVIYLKLKAIGIEPTVYSGLSLSDSSLSNRIELRYVPNSNALQLVVRVAGSAVVVTSHSITDITEIHKVAVEFEADNYSFWVNGVKVATDTSGALPINLSEFAFDDGTGANRINAKIYDARVYTTSLTDAELIELTTL